MASGELDNGITWKVENDGTGGVYSLTIEGSGDMPDFNVRNPCPWDSYLSNVYSVNISSDITKIGTGAFFGSAITSIKIPENCKEIGGKAFYRSNLKAVYIPANVETIGKDAFDYCSNLRLFHYDNSVTSKTVVNLTGISYSGKLIERATGTNGSYAKYPSNWEHYTHEEQCKGGAWVAECGTKLFFYAEEPGAIVNLAASGRVPAAVTNSPDYHPWRVNCYKYTSLEINKNVASIAGDELMGYENSDVTKSGFTSMKTITIENGSGNNYFYLDRYGALYDKEKTRLYLYPAKNTTTEIEIPATVTAIGSGAFYGAKKLKKITFLGTIKTFGQHAFGEASSLNYMYFTTTTAPSSYNAATFSGVANEGTVVAEANTDAFRTFTSTIGSNWTFDGETYGPVKSYISDGTLYVVGKGAYTTSSSDASWYSQRSTIKKIIVKEGITSIGYQAFAYCSNVTEATLNNKGNISTGAFKNCLVLKRVNIGTGVTGFSYLSTSDSPFKGCSNLSEINVTDLKSFCAISDIKYLTSSGFGTEKEKTLLINGVKHSSASVLEIPEGVKKIDNYAFRYFTNVTKIQIPSSIGGSINFSGHTYLTEVILNNKGVISNGAFENCTALTRVTIGTGVTGFDYSTLISNVYPFKGCSNLSEINVTDLKSFCAISDIKYLTASGFGTAEKKTLLINGVKHSSTSVLTIPEGVEKIDNYAFRYFTNVTKIQIPSSIGGSINFSGHTYLTEVILNNKGVISNGAFENCTALTRVTIGTGVTGFDYSTLISNVYPFKGCSNLSEINVTDLNSFYTLSDIKYLTSSGFGTAKEKTLLVNGVKHDANTYLYIPESITSYNNDVLKYFSNVKKICLSPKETSVRGFKNHTYLTDIILPASISYVEDNALYGCTSLKRIVSLAINAPTASANIAENPSDVTLKFPYSGYSSYTNATYWKKFNLEQGNFKRYDWKYHLKTKSQGSLTGYVSENVVSWISSDTTLVNVDKGAFSTGDFTYDGSTATSNRDATVSALTEDANTYMFNVCVYPREVVLTDGKAYKNTVDFEAENISYTRTFAEKYVDHLQCFYVPFDVEVTDDLLDDYTFYKLYMVSQEDKNGNGLIEEDEPLVMLLNRVPAGQVMKANMPYYIKPKAATTLTVTAQNATLYAAANGTVSCATTENEYTLTGIYDTTNIKGRYTMSAKGNFSYYTKDTNLGSYRWYMTVRDRMANGAELENYAHPIQILIEGEDDTTGIIALQDKTSAPQNDKVYTLDGRQVNNTDNLPSGIYIINGKKVFKK